MSLILRRNILIGQGGGPGPGPGPVIQRNYLISGSPTISGNSYIPVDTDGFIYTNIPFSPADSDSWTIQTKVKINTASAWKDIVSSVNVSGEKVQAMSVQTTTGDSNRQVKLYMSNNGTSWNVASAVCAKTIPIGSWYVFQIVCTRSGNNYVYKMGFPDASSWSSTSSKTTHPTYGNYISFGGGWGHVPDAEFDLSETKIFVNGSVVWEAITVTQQ